MDDDIRSGHLVPAEPVDGYGVAAGRELPGAARLADGYRVAKKVHHRAGYRESIGKIRTFQDLTRHQLDQRIDIRRVNRADAVIAGLLKGRIDGGQDGIVA